MRLNLVTVDSGWILQQIAQRMEKHMPHYVECTVKNRPYWGTEAGPFDAFYYCDIQNCYHNYKQYTPDATHIGYLTHAHENSEAWLRDMFDHQGVWELDGLKSMNQRYTDMAISIGWTKPILTTTPPANADDFPLAKTKLLIANRGGFEGYGHEFMLNLPDHVYAICRDKNYLADNFEFMFLGNGWQGIVNKYQDMGIVVTYKPDSDVDYPAAYVDSYRWADYLLVPILWTAGPYCAMEAHLCGVPIIASDVGLINYEIQPDYCYPPGDFASLLNILQTVRSPKVVARESIVSLNTWKTYTERIIDFIKECSNGG